MSGRGGHTTTPAVYPEPTVTKDLHSGEKIIIESCGENWAKYRGTAEDLIAVGLLPAEMLATVGRSGTKSARIICSDGETLSIRINRVGHSEWKVYRQFAPGHAPYRSEMPTFTPGNSPAYEPGRHHAGIDIERAEHWDSYTGTKDALINAKLATVGMFPVSPTRKKHYYDNIGVKNDWSVARIKGGKYRLNRGHERREQPAAPLTADQFKEGLIFSVDMSMGYLAYKARGDDQAQKTSWLPDDVVREITEARVRILSAIAGTHVVTARRMRFAVIDGGRAD